MKPLVGIIMGSDSDLPVMKEAALQIEEFDIPYEIKIVSAHRTPELMFQYAKDAVQNGLKVIIAGAGGAAHLPGMVAAITSLPVIGVPVQSKAMSGIDSLYSIVQMPPGVPVATMAVNGAKNAGILAAQIIGTGDKNVLEKIDAYKEGLKKMVDDKNKKLDIIRSIPLALTSIDIPKLGKKEQGKVRDIYFKKDKRILITTDRQSAFDVILGSIPFKGAVLNQLSQFWFQHTNKIVQNHMIEVPDPNVMITHNCQSIPVEMVVRGYISGVTTTSIWHSYQKGERVIYGIQFPEGLKKNQKLSKPVITPTTHGGGKNGHDERLTKEEIISRGLVDKKLYEQMEKAALALFEFGTKVCKQQGLILVDTKYEFGLHKGKLMLIDEIHTPDSSRFWIAESYKERFEKEREPENFDKEFLRLWYAEKGYKGDGPPPPMSEELIVQTAQRYISVYEKITGKQFVADTYPINERIVNNLKKLV